MSGNTPYILHVSDQNQLDNLKDSYCDGTIVFCSDTNEIYIKNGNTFQNFGNYPIYSSIIPEEENKKKNIKRRKK